MKRPLDSSANPAGCGPAARLLIIKYLLSGFDADVLTHAATIFEFDRARDLRKERIVFAPADVFTRLDGGTALADDDGTAGYELTAEDLHAEPLGVRIATVFRTA